MNKHNVEILRPEILAPAGNRDSFLAAVAAGADAIYCGLKLFSARMEAKNFTIEELTNLVKLAHKNNVRVFVAVNTLLKPEDLTPAGQLLDILQRQVKPDAIIIQDLAMVPLIQQTGFSGQIHLSTLANVGFARALQVIRQKLEVDCVVLPRELNVDELKTLAQISPPGLNLEVFVHGALCYSVSGRCYWSSYLGGKSSLRGRCVQPCRRRYTQSKKSLRYFSCQDLSIDVLAKVLLSIPKIRTWKIEGRKKGPHYVYYTVSAYRIFRDHGNDSSMKKNALQLLERALGRSGTHYMFLPQRPQNPVSQKGQTGSGLLVGRVKGAHPKSYIITREELLPGDVLRIGYEDEVGHGINRINRSVPKGGRYYIKSTDKRSSAKGASVFLTDRRDTSLNHMITDLKGQLDQCVSSKFFSTFKPVLPSDKSKKKKSVEVFVYRSYPGVISGNQIGLWLSKYSLKLASAKKASQITWWLPPVIWPENEEEILSRVMRVIKSGARDFVLNAPWQVAFFHSRKALRLWAGPFCNLVNPLAIAATKSMGFSGAIVSPELGAEDYLLMPRRSPLPLGIVISGNWPLCIARTLVQDVKQNRVFSSPRGEQAWVTRYEKNYWMYPNWRLDLKRQKKVLQKAGYSLFIHLYEPLPKTIKMKKREGLWNWKTKLL
jgi:putative protease